jgi:hypothetical protein
VDTASAGVRRRLLTRLLDLVFDEKDLAPITGARLAGSERFLMKAVEAAALLAIGSS